MFVQTLAITAYSLFSNIIWYHSEGFLPQSKLTLAATNYMWLINHAIDPIIYLIVKKLVLLYFIFI